MDKDKTRCPECARIMRYRVTLGDWVCRTCKLEFAFTVGRWFAAPVLGVKENIALVHRV